MMTKQEKVREGMAIILESVHKSPSPDGWALNIIEYLHSQGVVIRVDRELPEIPSILFRVSKGGQQTEDSTLQSESCLRVQRDMLKAGYVAVEPLLIKEVSSG